LGIEERYTEEEQKEYKVGTFTVPDFIGKTKKEMKDLLRVYEFGEIYTLGEGDIVIEQFPLPGEIVNKYSPLVLYYQ